VVDHRTPRLPARTARPTALTSRDLELLAFLAEQRIALPVHAASLLGVSVDAARARLARLAVGGYVRCEALFHAQPPMSLITRKGLEVIGSTLRAPRLDVRSYEHDVGLAWLWLAAHRGTFGPLREILSERRLRSHDAARGFDAHPPSPAAYAVEPLGVRLGGVGSRGRERLHYPDLLLRTSDGRRIALELELSSKGRVRLESILAGYGADPRIDGVVYLVERQSVARAVEDAARQVGVAGLVHLHRVRATVSSPAAAASSAAQRAAAERPGAASERRASAPERRASAPEAAR
jgi:hypothetical protein